MENEVEFLSIVDENDVEVEKTPFETAIKNNLRRRIVHVLIFNEKGEMALQMRSVHKSFCPQHWCTTVGGHVRFGESYEDAAMREMEEEIGITRNLEFVDKFHYFRKNLDMFLSVYKTTFNGPYEINPEEVERVEYFAADEIRKMIKNGEKFHPELLFLLKNLKNSN